MSHIEPQTVGDFFSLTPDLVLDAVEQSGHRTTGLCYALNSLENRVYEVELDEGERVVAKFYRPGRWTRDAIGDEHRLLLELNEHEIPVCTPLEFPDGQTLHQTESSIWFALFPRTGGRHPDELDAASYEQLGRLLARIHNTGAGLTATGQLQHRLQITPATYGAESLGAILGSGHLPISVSATYADAARTFIDHATRLFGTTKLIMTHGDCHRGNLLNGQRGWFFLDFDDMGYAPAVQDIWLLLPARPQECPQEVTAFLHGYEQFRPFARSELQLIEALRGLRYIRYAAWIATRWQDPAFPRAFPDWGTDAYWQRQTTDLYEQTRQLLAIDSYAER